MQPPGAGVLGGIRAEALRRNAQGITGPQTRDHPKASDDS